MMLIGITGKKRHGKDTVGECLSRRYKLRHDAFAAPIKHAAREWFDLTADQVYGDVKEVLDPRWNRTPREIMQLLGTEVARTIHPDVWARAAMARHERYRDATELPRSWRGGTVIVDVRFPNEARILREHGGIIVYVVRPGLPDGPFAGHASETSVEAIGAEAEITVVNSGTLDDLAAAVAALHLGAP